MSLVHFNNPYFTNFFISNIDGFVKCTHLLSFVIPAKAGIQCFQKLMTALDPGFRRGDDFLRHYQYYIHRGDWASDQPSRSIPPPC